MSAWNHAICWSCWVRRNPDRVAHRVTTEHLELCCFCGETTSAGIYVRENPADVPCHGKSGKHAEGSDS